MRISRLEPVDIDRPLVEVDKKNKTFQFFEVISERLGYDFNYVGLHQWMYDGLTFYNPDQVLQYILKQREEKGGTPLKAGTYTAQVESVKQMQGRTVIKLRNGGEVVINT